MITHRHTEPQQPTRVVVIGARGFIGAALRTRLAAAGVEALPITSSDIDLREQAAVDALTPQLRASDAVVMLAALTPDKGRDITALMKNLAMMQHVCAALEKTGCAHLVYISSDAVYAPEVSHVTEETPPTPRDLYGAMHYTRELMARSLTKTPVLVLRPTLVYGLGDTHNSYGPNRFRRSAHKEGKIALFGGGEETRDHIHVDDVASLAVRCLMHASIGTLNVATGTSRSFYEVAELIARQFSTVIDITKTARANPITHRHYDVTHLIKAFPDFRFIDLSEGVARIHREMKAQG